MKPGFFQAALLATFFASSTAQLTASIYLPKGHHHSSKHTKHTKVGPRGPQGPTGPRGPQGPQGLPGSSPTPIPGVSLTFNYTNHQDPIPGQQGTWQLVVIDPLGNVFHDHIISIQDPQAPQALTVGPPIYLGRYTVAIANIDTNVPGYHDFLAQSLIPPFTGNNVVVTNSAMPSIKTALFPEGASLATDGGPGTIQEDSALAFSPVPPIP